MKFLLITIVSVILTFMMNPLFRMINRKVMQKGTSKFHAHHSVAGVGLIALGIFIKSEVVIAIGLGIYLAHGLEEIYYNKRNPIIAFFIFFTR